MIWRATAAHRRAVLAGTALAFVGALTRRLDLVVLAAPLLVAAAWGLATRPQGHPAARTNVDRLVAYEGETVLWQAFITAPPGAEDVALLVSEDPYLAGAHSRARLVAGPGVADPPETIGVDIDLVALRWGPRRAGPALVATTSALGAFRWAPGQFPEVTISVLPRKLPLTVKATMPHPIGVVGLNPSSRPGEGTEFAGLRAYQMGDRLRHIHWPATARAGTIQVTTTRADQDTEVLLVLDAHHDIGHSGGVGGAASSLDRGVRGATALAEHYLRRGDRVGLIVLGAAHADPVPVRSGRAHLHRILDTIATIQPGSSIPRADRSVRRYLATRLRPDAVVIVLTPGISDDALTEALTMRRNGITVLIVDCLPPAMALARIGLDDLHAVAPTFHRRDREVTRLAWRLRMLERTERLNTLRTNGIAIVPWSGGASLEQVLRQLRRNARAPRLARR